MYDWSPVDLLPGLYAALLGWLLAAALRRWFDRVPPRVLAAFAVALVPLLGPVLAGGKILLPLDNLRGHVPFTALAPTVPHGNALQGDLIELVTPSLVVARTAWGYGRWPLWNRLVGAGMPLLADPQAQALQPLALAGLPLPPARAAGVTAALRLWTALVFMFLLLRAQGIGEAPAVAGAFAYGLGGFLLLWLGWPLATSAALLPAVLYGVVRCDHPGGRRDCLLLTVAAACLLLGGHPETVLYATLFALLFLGDRARRLPAGTRRPLLVRSGLAWLLAAGLAAPALLPTWAYMPQTLRAARLRQAQTLTAPAPSAAAPRVAPERSGPLEELARRWLPIAAPNAYGNSRFIHYWGLSNTNEDASGFAGTATLLAALLALGARRRLPQEWLTLACAGVCLLALAVPAPRSGGLAAALLGSRRLLLPLTFCLAYLAACTWERFRRGEVSRRRVLGTAALLALLLAWGYLAHPDPTDPGRLVVLRMGWLRWQLRFLAAATLLLVASPRRRRGVAAAAMAGLVAAELLLAHLPANPPSPRRLAFPFNRPLGLLYGRRAEGRMAALGRALPPNLASIYELSDVRIYNPMAPAAYADFVAPITAAWWGELPQFGAPSDPLYGRLGVRFLLTAPGERPGPPWQLALADPAGWVYRRPTAQPVLFVAGAPAAAGLAGPGATSAPGRSGLAAASSDPAPVIRHFEDGWFSIRATAPGPDRLLGSGIYQDGAWRLLVDGRPQPTTVLDGPFVAAPLSPGRHRLELLYRPGAFVAGCLAAALALATLYVLGAPPPRRPRVA